MLLLLLATQMVQAQVDVNSIQPVLRQQKGHYFLAPDIAVFKTASAISIDSAIRLDRSGKFENRHSAERIFVPHVKDFYWLRFSLNQNTTLSDSLFLVLGSSLVFDCQLFAVADGHIISLGRQGTLVPAKLRKDFSFLYYYELPGGNGIHEYYLLMDSRRFSLYVLPMLFYKQQYHYLEKRAYSLYGVFTGILLLAAFFNLFLYFVIKDRIHLTYFFYALCNWLMLLSYRNLDYQFLYPHFTLAAMISRMFYSALSAVFLLVISRKFLGQTRKNSRFYRPGVLLQVTGIAFIAILLLSETNMLPGFITVRKYVLIVFCLAVIGLILASCVEGIRKGMKIALLFFIAIITLLAGAIEYILANLGLLDVDPIPPNLFEFGIVLESFIIFLAILYRYNLFKKENEQLAKNIQIQKELFSGELLSTLESEQKRMAQDLHDDLGGNLAALKMTLQSFNLPETQSAMALKLIDTSSENIRNISHNLMPPEFDQIDLTTLLASHYQQLSTHSNIRFQFYHSGHSSFTKREDLMIYRIIMELTNNIIKHSGATEATVQLIYYDGFLKILAEDNGTGIKDSSSSGIGLKNIRSRINYLSGNFSVDSSHLGTTIVLTIPQKEEGTVIN